MAEKRKAAQRFNSRTTLTKIYLGALEVVVLDLMALEQQVAVEALLGKEPALRVSRFFDQALLAASTPTSEFHCFKGGSVPVLDLLETIGASRSAYEAMTARRHAICDVLVASVIRLNCRIRQFGWVAQRLRSIGRADLVDKLAPSQSLARAP
jgi:hypothetical protein